MTRKPRRIHVLGEFLHYPNPVQESHRRRNSRGGEKAKAQTPFSSVGEERALLLGFIMMAFSTLMYLVVGVMVVKPSLHSDWQETAVCALVQAEFLNESDERRGVSGRPCLLVSVNVTDLRKTRRLRYNEAAVTSSPECFYISKNHQNKMELLEEAQNIKNYLSSLLGQAMMCHLSTKYPEDAIVERRYTIRLALNYLIWPTLVLAGGALLVGLVMLTQHLAQLSAEIAVEVGEGDETMATQGKLYRLLGCRPRTPSME